MQPRISYIDPATIKDQVMLDELDRCRREGTPRPSSYSRPCVVFSSSSSFKRTSSHVTRVVGQTIATRIQTGWNLRKGHVHGGFSCGKPLIVRTFSSLPSCPSFALLTVRSR